MEVLEKRRRARPATGKTGKGVTLYLPDELIERAEEAVRRGEAKSVTKFVVQAALRGLDVPESEPDAQA